MSEILADEESSKLAQSKQWLIEDDENIAQSSFTGGPSQQRKLESLIDSIQTSMKDKPEEDQMENDPAPSSRTEHSEDLDLSSERRNMRLASKRETLDNKPQREVQNQTENVDVGK